MKEKSQRQDKVASTGALPIPRSVVRRFPQYLLHMQRLRQKGSAWVSSTDIAAALGMTPSTVRQDLIHIEYSGVAKRGYSISDLETALAQALGADREFRMLLVGAGHLGRALIQHGEISRQRFVMVAAFDRDRRIIGSTIGGITVKSMDDLAPTVSREGVEIGVIAVPSDAAQSVADLLVVSGIKGLLNLAAVPLAVPTRVPVVDARIVTSLQVLAYEMKIQARLPTDATPKTFSPAHAPDRPAARPVLGRS
jgi:redox-sensing transcriptional repressor